jgi:hypothetical protein
MQTSGASDLLKRRRLFTTAPPQIRSEIIELLPDVL